jgi:hypothetical protein
MQDGSCVDPPVAPLDSVNLLEVQKDASGLGSCCEVYGVTVTGSGYRTASRTRYEVKMKVRKERTIEPAGERRSARRLVRVAVSVPLVLVLFALLSPAAWAHQASVTITCKKVAYNFFDFPNEPGNTVHEKVYEDGLRIASQSYTFSGATGGNTIRTMIVGDQTIQANVRWDTNGAKGQVQVSKSLVGCGGIG